LEYLKDDRRKDLAGLFADSFLLKNANNQRQAKSGSGDERLAIGSALHSN